MPEHNEGSQIDIEHTRLLAEYERELLNIDRAIESELEAVRDAVRFGKRFNIRHSILNFAGFVQRLDAKLTVFGNFPWRAER